MSLKNKAAKIDLTNLSDDPVLPPATVAPPAQLVADEGAPLHAHARGRSGVAAITNTINTQHRIQDLEQEVASLKTAQVVVKLDPKSVKQSRWKNRDELSFATKAYADLKREIADAGGNVQAIKVRRVPVEQGAAQEYEVVYGRRRLRACLELGLPVNAIIEDMGDLSVFVEMERENRNREDLSPWEQGVMYKHGLDAGLFASQRQMATALGLNLSMLSTAIRLGSLPSEIVEAFASPLEIQFRWSKPLLDALEKDPVKVTKAAREIARSSPRRTSKDVLDQLVKAASGEADAAGHSVLREVKVGSRVIGSVQQSRRGAISLKIEAGVLSAKAVGELEAELVRLARAG